MSLIKFGKKNGKELVVTCGTNGVHSAGSLHYYGLAIDFRTKYFTKGVAEKVARELRKALGPKFDVIVHRTKFSNHIHVEFDPKDNAIDLSQIRLNKFQVKKLFKLLNVA